ncbi:MAG: SOS response-associated peptidase [Balneolaceae bacterium]|nr:SOS response-associated peptidase [Balneolaceae bacterium]
MCGRYVLKSTLEELKKTYNAIPDGLYEFEPKFNVAPSLQMPVVFQGDENRIIAPFRWGLVPFWANKPDTGYSMINARSESLRKKRSFSKPFSSQRCVVPANGFYEWKRSSSGKVPHYIYSPDYPVLHFAGLYEHWESSDGEQINSFTIITTQANTTIGELHDRMPAILLPDETDAWLDPSNNDLDTLQDLLRPWPDDAITFYRVGTEVNNARNSGPRLMEPYRDLFS